MATMTIAGAEIPKDFTENIGKISGSKELEKRQIEKNLKIMQNSLEDIEPENFGLTNLSLENFRQDLTKETAEKFRNYPNGIFSGFKANKKGLIALLKHKKTKEQKLIFIDEQSNEIFINQMDILQFLRANNASERFVPKLIEDCEETEIAKLTKSLQTWIINQIPQITIKETKNLFAGKLPTDDIHIEDKFVADDWNLICWEVITNEK
jgi:hypothetical protein